MPISVKLPHKNSNQFWLDGIAFELTRLEIYISYNENLIRNLEEIYKENPPEYHGRDVEDEFGYVHSVDGVATFLGRSYSSLDFDPAELVSEEIIQRIRYSNLVMVFSSFEDSLRSLCEAIYRRGDCSSKWNDRGRGFDRIKKYLAKSSADSGKINQTAGNTIDVISEIRNAVVHREGGLNGARYENLNRKINKSRTIGVSDEQYVTLKDDFLYSSLRAFYKYASVVSANIPDSTQ